MVVVVVGAGVVVVVVVVVTGHPLLLGPEAAVTPSGQQPNGVSSQSPSTPLPSSPSMHPSLFSPGAEDRNVEMVNKFAL